ncbi:hypothetical protein WA577_002265, partial [Blastocystis sp. JDR]
MEKDQLLLEPIHNTYVKIEEEGEEANSYLRSIYQSMENVIVSIKKGEEGVNEKCAEVRALIDEVRKFLLPYEVKRVLEDVKTLQSVCKRCSQKEKKLLFSSRNRKTAVIQPVVRVEPSTVEPIPMLAYVLSGRSGECVNVKCDEDVVNLVDLTSCVVIICETKKSIHVKNVKGSIVLLRDVKGSILVNDAESCMFTSHCEQIRIHNSKNTLFALAIPNHPIIEDCSSLFFAEDTSVWDGEAPCRIAANLYDKVLDFKWLKQEQS